MKYLVFIICFTGCVLPCVRAQIGINTQHPHSSAALHINALGDQGLLIPIADNAARARLINQAARGLLVCDTTYYPIPVFYFYNGSSWIALNPLQAADGNSNTLKPSDGGTTITVDSHMTINNTLVVAEGININSTLTTGNISATGLNAGTGGITAGTVSSGTVNTTTIDATTANIATANVTTVNAVTLNGFDTTPLGGIIMWSGDVDVIPDGWALCDGSEQNGRTTPDLKGRFIVGYYKDVPEYSAVNNIGGKASVILTGAEMPKHTHFGDSPRGDDGGHSGKYFESNSDLVATNGINTDDGQEHGRTGWSGGNEAHENRPPFYVLAFIMRTR